MADEVIEVEATPIDQELSVLSRAEKWLAGAAERVAVQCEQYKPPARIESEQQRKECTAARTSVRKDLAAIDAERKAMLRDAEDALKKFKSNVKDVLNPLSDLDAEYKRLLDEYEEAWKTERVIELTEEYEKEMPEFGFRLKVKAGLTGYAQVTGAYDTTPYDKLKMDLMYIENYSIRLDLQIILMTIKTMFFPPKNNAEMEETLLMPKNSNKKGEHSK